MPEQTDKSAQNASALFKGGPCRHPRLGPTCDKVSGLTLAQIFGSIRRRKRPGKLHLPLAECLQGGGGGEGSTGTPDQNCHLCLTFVLVRTDGAGRQEELRTVPSTQRKYSTSLSHYYYSLMPTVSSERARKISLDDRIIYWLIHEIRRGNLDSAELGLEGQDNSAVSDAFPLFPSGLPEELPLPASTQRPRTSLVTVPTDQSLSSLPQRCPG